MLPFLVVSCGIATGPLPPLDVGSWHRSPLHRFPRLVGGGCFSCISRRGAVATRWCCRFLLAAARQHQLTSWRSFVSQARRSCSPTTPGSPRIQWGTTSCGPPAFFSFRVPFVLARNRLLFLDSVRFSPPQRLRGPFSCLVIYMFGPVTSERLRRIDVDRVTLANKPVSTPSARPLFVRRDRVHRLRSPVPDIVGALQGCRLHPPASSFPH